MKNLAVIWLLVTGLHGYSQEFNYTHYNTKDGLAGMTVYDMCQDRSGFMWFATENGLSRFDGASFRNFTVKDGLPDNEVLKVFADSRGRVWIGGFNKRICFYYNGKIHHRLSKTGDGIMTMAGSLVLTDEDKRGNVYLCDGKNLVMITPEDSMVQLTNLPEFARRRWKTVSFSCSYMYDHLWVHLNDSVFRFVNNRLLFHLPFPQVGDKAAHTSLLMNDSGIVRYMTKPAPFLNAIADKTRMYVRFYCSTNGAWEFEPAQLRVVHHFLAGKKVTRAMDDTEGNLWFCTLGEGLYKLPSTEIRTFSVAGNYNISDHEVFSLAKSGGKLYAGLNYSKLQVVDAGNKIAVNDYTKQFSRSDNAYENNRLYCSKLTSSGALILGFDAFLAKIENGRTSYSYIYPIKSVEEIDREHIVVGSSGFAFKMRISDLKITDTIWRERCTKVFYHGNKYYIATLGGLYEVNEDKTHRYLGGLHTTLSRRITDIKASGDGALWIAGSDNGIVALKNGRITAVLKDSNGLSSNICRTFFLQNNFLWAGTSAGLNKIDIGNPRMPVTRYTTDDGLPDNSINAIYAEDSIIWVGTPAGLSYFNENNISRLSICKLHMLGVTVSAREMAVDSIYILPYRDNNISYSFTAVSFKSAGEITYYYRLGGLHSDWRQTRQNSLDYQSLPPGDYELELYAVNKFGVRSNTVSIQMRINRPFWLAWWFYGLLLLALLGMLVFFMQKRNRRQSRMLEEKNKTQQQFAALEQQALQAQMNPHFIFNCLNSIQQYILTNEKEKANLYLTGFASLVRQTLDHSGRKTVTVAEEATYLRQYLEMEQMRFGDNFSFIIDIAPDVRADFTEIPALLLQPYVENALRHGIRHKQNGAGTVAVRFSVNNGQLQCVISDNGVGRQKAAEYKSRQHIEYQSRGMSLTAKRVELLNRVNHAHITIQVEDLTDGTGSAAGTRVTIKIPV